MESKSLGLFSGFLRTLVSVLLVTAISAAAWGEILGSGESDISDGFVIAAVGDIMPGRGFDTLFLSPGGPEETLGDVLPLLLDADLLIGNLETAVTDADTRVEKTFNFKVSDTIVRALVEDAGFDFLHLANNHGWDYGEQGFLDTLEAVEDIGVGYSGAGRSLEESRFYKEYSTPEGRIRILSLGAYFTEGNGFNGAEQHASAPGKPGVLWDSPENEDFIRKVLGREDVFTIVTVHGGYEWEESTRKNMREKYYRYVDWGADLVLAHHPHVLQGMEEYRGGLIVYSLGNFIFPGMKGWYTGEETGVLYIFLKDGVISGTEFYPVRLDGPRLRLAEKGSGIGARFRELSRKLNEDAGD